MIRDMGKKDAVIIHIQCQRNSTLLRSEYIVVQKRRYHRAGKVYKTRLIDEVCEVCGYFGSWAGEFSSGLKLEHRIADYFADSWMRKNNFADVLHPQPGFDHHCRAVNHF